MKIEVSPYMIKAILNGKCKHLKNSELHFNGLCFVVGKNSVSVKIYSNNELLCTIMDVPGRFVYGSEFTFRVDGMCMVTMPHLSGEY